MPKHLITDPKQMLDFLLRENVRWNTPTFLFVLKQPGKPDAFMVDCKLSFHDFIQKSALHIGAENTLTVVGGRSGFVVASTRKFEKKFGVRIRVTVPSR
jgi:hypothetical protein